MRILGIDFGTKRIGLALSDETHTFAREHGILSPKEFWAQLSNLISTEQIERIVVGLPLNMSGGETEKSREVHAFAGQLTERARLPIELMDERLTSVMASGLPGGKSDVDSLAAQIILQNYLDKNKQ